MGADRFTFRVTGRGEERRARHLMQRRTMALQGARTEAALYRDGQYEREYKDKMTEFSRVNTSPFYLYTPVPSFEPDEIIPLGGEFFNMYYNKAVPTWNNVVDSFKNLGQITLEFGEAQDFKIEEYISYANDILGEGYNLVSAFNRFDDEPMTAPRGVTFLNPSTLIDVKKFVGQIGSRKPEEFRETLRRFTPRWMWHPLDAPTDMIPPEQEELFQKVWSGYTSKDASNLIHPDRLVEGKAPFHMAYKAAERMEGEGAEDLGYAIRTRAITDLLPMEKASAEREKNPEMPFFALMFFGAISGEAKPAPPSAHFDYAAAISDTMEKTFARLQKEMDEGKDGPAIAFLNTLSEYMGLGISALLARGLVQAAKASEAFDEVSILRGVSQREFPWAERIIANHSVLSEGSVIKKDEVEELVAKLPVRPDDDPTNSADVCIKHVTTIIGNEDVASVKSTIPANGGTAEVDIDLDSFSETMDVTLRFKVDGRIRTVPFSLNFYGDPESLQMDLLSQDGLSEATIASLRGNVLRSLGNIADKKRQKERKQGKGGKAQPTTIVAEPRRFAIQELDREARRARYHREDWGGERRAAKAGTPTVLFETGAAQQSAPEKPQRKIHVRGLNKRTVQHMLDEEKIQVVDADRVLKKLRDIITVTETGLTETGRLTLGKKLTLNGHGTLANGIKLNQVSWNLEGRTDLRIYLEDLGNDHYRLRGILNKKGFEMQERYIANILREIQREKSKVA